MAQSVTIKKWNWWYDSIIDEMLANPEATQNEIAKALNCSVAWLSIIKNTDMFQERFAERRGMMSQNIDSAIQGKVANLAMKSLDMVLERLEGDGAARIPTASIMEIADKSLNRLGYGVKPAGPQVVVNNNTVSVGASPEALREARERIRMNETKMIEAGAENDEAVGRGSLEVEYHTLTVDQLPAQGHHLGSPEFDPLNLFDSGDGVLESAEPDGEAVDA